MEVIACIEDPDVMQKRATTRAVNTFDFTKNTARPSSNHIKFALNPSLVDWEQLFYAF